MTVLETSRLRLVPCSVELAIALVAEARSLAAGLLAAQLPDGWPDAELAELLPGYAQAVAADPELLGWGPWIVVEGERVAGSAGFLGQPAGGTVELGYGIAPEARCRGVATEAAQALLAWALADPRVREVVAEVEPENAASHRVLKKIGMRRAGTVNEHERWALTLPEQGLTS